MEEILQNLIKSYSETKSSHEPKQFQLYSNLTVTQSLHQQCELTAKIERGINFLSECVLLGSGTGLQSHPMTNSLLKGSEENEKQEAQFDSLLNSENGDSSSPQFPLEIYTSILALDILGDLDSDSEPSVQTLSPAVIRSLIDFIIPDTGISTFGIFKSGEHHSSPRPNSAATSSSGCSSNEFDMDPASPCRSDRCDHQDEEESVEKTIAPILPNDCNTTALALSILLREGILDIKPTASVTELLLSNVGDFSADDSYPGVMRAFLNGSGTIDAVACANVLYLYYVLTEDIDTAIVGRGGGVSLNYTENVESIQLFLLHTLNNLLTSDHCHDCDANNDNNNSSCPFELHPCPDTFIYALSRCTTISVEARKRFSEPLISLLDSRVGVESCIQGPLNLAMRILSADSLGLLGPNGIWMRRKLEAECCKLAALQDESDGGWPADAMFKIELKNMSESKNKQVYFGGRELSTVFGIRALQVFRESVTDAKIQGRSYNDYGY